MLREVSRAVSKTLCQSFFGCDVAFSRSIWFEATWFNSVSSNKHMTFLLSLFTQGGIYLGVTHRRPMTLSRPHGLAGGERSSAAHAVVQAAWAASNLNNVTFLPTGSESSCPRTNYLSYFLIIIRLQKISQNALVSKVRGGGNTERAKGIPETF